MERSKKETSTETERLDTELGKEVHKRGNLESSCSQRKETEVEDELSGLSFRIGHSRRYSVYRRDFYQKINSLTTLLILVSGSAIFLETFSYTPYLQRSVSFLVVVISFIGFTQNWSQKISEYDQRARKYNKIQRKVEKFGPKITEEDLRSLKSRTTKIERDEPATLRNLDLICHNEERQYRGHELGYKIYWYQELFKNLISLPPNPKKICD